MSKVDKDGGRPSALVLSLRGICCQRGFSIFELVIVLVMIGVLAALWLYYTQDILDDARKTAVEVQSRNFAIAAAHVRAQWMVEGVQKSKTQWVNFENTLVYVNEFGWPVGTEVSKTLTSRNCHQLWLVLLHNPSQVTVAGEKGNDQQGTKSYHISSIDGQRCRYQFITTISRLYYFDYIVKTGQVFVNVP